jgi:hypothetical protein
MPARHRYKCLNPNCPSMTDKRKPMTFDAMNSPMPTCPHCASRRVQDWGEAINHMGGLSDNTKNSDRNFRNVADRYGLTNMDNKDGRAVKRPHVSPPTQGPSVKIGGIEVPAGMAAGAACVNLPGMAQKIPQATAPRSAPKSPMMKQMTRVVGEHKASA